jgi:hypothetical protein
MNTLFCIKHPDGTLLTNTATATPPIFIYYSIDYDHSLSASAQSPI